MHHYFRFLVRIQRAAGLVRGEILHVGENAAAGARGMGVEA